MTLLNKEQLPELKITQLMLLNTLLSMLKTHNYHAITITELALNAEVGRKTFYRHYHSIDDILYYYIRHLMTDLAQSIPDNVTNRNEFLTYFFTYWSQHEEFLKLLTKHKICYSMILVAENLCRDDDFLRLLSGKVPVGYIANQYSQAFAIAGLFRTLQYWIVSDKDVSIEDLVNTLSQ